MIIRRSSDIAPSDITPEEVYLRRRALMKGALLGIGGALLPSAHVWAQASSAGGKALSFTPVAKQPDSRGFYTGETLTPFKDVTSYNNFYEFGTGKSDPASQAHKLTLDPWSVTVEGEAEVTGRFDLEDILSKVTLEERIYRLRCVEAWSMVIPWIGFPLSQLLQRFKPTSKARYVAFETLVRPEEMPGQSSAFATIDWPYQEGLRMDEAMHPLTLMATGLYGRELPAQNGAPWRLVVPWKYGFKSIKSIVKIRFTETQPATTWSQLAPREYGFYANVNPQVDHPRWSQKYERRLPSSLFAPNRIETLPFNGYGEQVASLYKGMDLRKFY